MSRLLLLMGLSLRTRLRGLISSGASSIFIVLGGIFYLFSACALGFGAYLVLSRSQGIAAERVADFVSLAMTFFGVFFMTRPLLLTSFAGGSLQNLLHLPIRRGELLAYSLITGVATPLLLESPVLIGAAIGAASQPALILLTFPLALLAHLTLLFGAHAMSLLAIAISRWKWTSDLARLVALAALFLPSLLTYRGARAFLRPLLEPLALISPFGWAARAAVYAGEGDLRRGLLFVFPALLLLLAIASSSLALLNRILSGEGDGGRGEKTLPRTRARVLIPGALGALIEMQLRTQLRTPAARMALFLPTVMMGFLALTVSRPQGPGLSPIALAVFLSIAGGNAFLLIGRGVAMILGTKVARSSILMASDVSGLFFRLPPILAIVAVTAWRGGGEPAFQVLATFLTLVPISMGAQHFVSILAPFALPRDRFNPFAQRVDARQGGNGLVSLLATLATLLAAAPFLLLLWLSSRVAEGAYASWLISLACLGGLAMYAVLITLAERLLARRELRVLEILLDDSPG